jgi:hypothetical protein
MSPVKPPSYIRIDLVLETRNTWMMFSVAIAVAVAVEIAVALQTSAVAKSTTAWIKGQRRLFWGYQKEQKSHASTELKQKAQRTREKRGKIAVPTIMIIIIIILHRTPCSLLVYELDIGE